MLTTEICVIMLFAAAAVIAYAVRPSSSGPARQHLLAGTLSHEGPDDSSLDIDCRDDGTVTIWRNGLTGLTSYDAVSLAINIRGFDIEINERIHRGNISTTASTDIDSAFFTIDFLACELYHITYKIDGTVAAAFTMHVRHGMPRHVALTR